MCIGSCVAKDISGYAVFIWVCFFSFMFDSWIVVGCWQLRVLSLLIDISFAGWVYFILWMAG